jgi:hypothetical protein
MNAPAATAARVARYDGHLLRSYVDPHPGAKASDKVFQACGNCDGSGVYGGYSSWRWQKGNKVAKWCFDCNGSGKYGLTVATLRKRAKEAAYRRDYADEIAAAAAASAAAYLAAELAQAWEEAHAEQARRAALVTGFAGAIGDRVRDLAGVIRFAKTYDASFGFRKATGMFMIIELDNGQVVKLAGTGRSLWGHERGDHVLVTGTVKAHETYEGQEQTVLTRATVTPREGEEE